VLPDFYPEEKKCHLAEFGHFFEILFFLNNKYEFWKQSDSNVIFRELKELNTVWKGRFIPSTDRCIHFILTLHPHCAQCRNLDCTGTSSELFSKGPNEKII